MILAVELWAMLEELRLHTMTSAKMESANFLNIFLNIQIPPQKLPPLCICSLNSVSGAHRRHGVGVLYKPKWAIWKTRNVIIPA
ncbi:MAG: hypothetical protein O7E51_07445 [Acidobacteria bacterium]|nr:hypothetical protein [Acidobacteriota bacterium]